MSENQPYEPLDVRRQRVSALVTTLAGHDSYPSGRAPGRTGVRVRRAVSRLCGAVTLGERARVLHGAVPTAEDGEIWIGEVTGSTVEDEVFIATGAALFPRSVAGTGSELRINSVVRRSP